MSRNTIDIINSKANPLDLVDSIVQASENGDITYDDLEICRDRLQAELENRDQSK